MNKKKVIISYHNLPPKVMEAFKEKYMYGYSEFISKITKPNNDVIYVVPLDTEDASYMVKIDVKVDSKMTDEDFDKLLFTGLSGSGVKVPSADDMGEDTHGDDEESDSGRIDTDSIADSSVDDD